MKYLKLSVFAALLSLSYSSFGQEHIGNCAKPSYGFYHSLEDFIWNKPKDTLESISVNSGKVYFDNVFFPHDAPPKKFALGFTSCHETYWYVKGGYYPVIQRGRYSLIKVQSSGDSQLEATLNVKKEDVLNSQRFYVLDLATGDLGKLNKGNMIGYLSEDAEILRDFENEEVYDKVLFIAYLTRFNELHDKDFFAMSAKSQ